jgi:hypothetical protein
VARLSEIELLEVRRQRLLAESSRLRTQLGTEIGQLHATTGWLKSGFSFFQSARPYWPLVVAGAGFLLTKKRSGTLRALDRILAVWRIAKKAFHFWRQHSDAGSPPEKER